jgi:hypothetical protein
MHTYGDDIYTEPARIDPDTLRNLGPLRRIAGVWEGRKGLDVNPGADGVRRQQYVERISLQPIDPQANGPQLFYGLHYVTRVLQPDEPATYHHQTGYWLWEAATETIIHTLAIPRAQVAMAIGRAAADATSFELVARRGDPSAGICSGPFLDYAFRTESFRIAVRLNADGSWSYEEDTVMQVRGLAEPFHHTDANTLFLVSAPLPNPLMRS